MSNEITKPRYSIEQKQKCMDLYVSGRSSIEIFRQTNISTGTICRWARKLGISRKHGGSKLKYPHIINIAIELYKSGLSTRELSEKLSIKRPTISKWVRDIGISRRRGAVCGSKNHFWRGGITSESARIKHSLQYRLWRMSVLERDNFTCQDCGNVGGDLHAHHILEFSKYKEKRFDVDNGITLCCRCHSNLHGRYVGFLRRA